MYYRHFNGLHIYINLIEIKFGNSWQLESHLTCICLIDADKMY